MNEIKIDLAGKAIGRAASEVARILMGKNDLNFAYNKVTKIIVTVENIGKLKIDPVKAMREKYYRHSGYLGSLKQTSMKQRVADDLPGLFKSVVKGMLPRNRLLDERLKHLRIK